MLDVVVIAMVGVIIALTISIYLVRVRKNYRWHKTIQLVTAAALLVTLLAFEIDVRFITDWRELAKASPYYETGWVTTVLIVHLFFAIPTPIVWIIVIVGALRNIPNPPAPSPYSRRHRRWAWIAAILMYMTAFTGWLFYWIAFCA